MDDIASVLTDAGKLIEDHAWLPLASMVIYALTRLIKDDRFVAWFPITIEPRYRSWFAVALGVASGVLQALTTGAKWPTAMVGGLISAYTAISGHDLIVESLRKGRDIGVPKDGGGSGGPTLGSRKSQPSTYSTPFKIFALATVVALATPGCAAIKKAEPDIVKAIAATQSGLQEANIWISIIQSAAELMFANAPASDAAVTFRKGADAVKLALAGLARAANGADDVQKEQYDAAAADFKSAWRAFLGSAKALGIVASDGTLSAKLSARQGVHVPELLLLAGK